MDNLFNKLSSAISSEVLGEVDEFGQPLNPNKNQKKKTKPAKKPAIMRTKKEIKVPVIDKSSTNRDIIAQQSIDITTPQGKYPVLKFLHIDLAPNLENLITPDDIANVEFSITAPTGLNADEIEQFCDSVQRDISQYINLIEQRQADFMKLLEHCEELSQKLVDQKQESELASFIIERQTAEDKLKEQLVTLRLENAELQRKLDQLTKERKPTNNLPHNKEENQYTENTVNTNLPNIDIITNDTAMQTTAQPIRKFTLDKDIDEFMSIDEDPFDAIIEDLK